MKLLDQWVASNLSFNRRCDILVVDSCSPFKIDISIQHVLGVRKGLSIKRFDDNIGHLARGGRDGWGRAFSYGLLASISGGYDYVVHIEGDSLFRLSVEPIIEQMRSQDIKVMSTPVKGTKTQERGWIETGLMFFNVEYLVDSNFVNRYNWTNSDKKYPYTPEHYINEIVKNDIVIGQWNGIRNDADQITIQNLEKHEIDWITHCKKQEVYDHFVNLFKD